MRLHKFNLKNFRNHKNFDFDFEGNSYLITGLNGSGKSNILEAIHMLSTTKSLRTHYDKDVILFEEPFARLEAQVQTNGDDTLLEMVVTKSSHGENTTQKKVRINKVNKSINKFAGTFTSVLFTPIDIEILTGSPAIRRKYLDMLFFQIDPDYKKATSQYTKALRQRNKLLENISEDSYNADLWKDQLPYWTDKVLEAGQIIQDKRTELASFINEKITKHTTSLNEKNVKYDFIYDKNEISRERLAKYEQIEIAAKRTLVGPSKDDFYVHRDDINIAVYGSRGQQRTAVLALMLCQMDFITEKNNGNRPVLLLDDIYSELDPEHREAIDNVIKMQQTIITSAHDVENGGLSFERV